MIKVSPSILSADFARLSDEIKNVLGSGADYIHFDVMDGMFVPNITIGIPVLKSVRAVTDAVLDVHLMIERPLRYTGDFLNAGADILILHTEASEPGETLEALRLIKNADKVPAVSIKPDTPAEAVLPYIHLTGLILVMTVEPGFSGQAFMPEVIPKIAAVRAYIEKFNPACELAVDGGINEDTAPLCVQAGAQVLVAGNAVFGARDRAEKIRRLKASGGSV